MTLKKILLIWCAFNKLPLQWKGKIFYVKKDLILWSDAEPLSLHSVNVFLFLSSIFVFMYIIRATWQVNQPTGQCLGWVCAASFGTWNNRVLKIDVPALPHNTTVQKYVYLLAIPNCEEREEKMLWEISTWNDIIELHLRKSVTTFPF